MRAGPGPTRQTLAATVPPLFQSVTLPTSRTSSPISLCVFFSPSASASGTSTSEPLATAAVILVKPRPTATVAAAAAEDPSPVVPLTRL